MAKPIRPSLYSVPFGNDLCDATVAAIFDKIGEAPLALCKATIFLPNNRAIRSMTEAFVRRAQPGLLLPKMVAVGDLALDEALAPIFEPLDTAADIPAAIPAMQRLMLLAGLVKHSHAAAGNALNPNEALRLARHLGEVVDELEIEQVGFASFKDIDPGGDLAEHWQSSYAQLLQLVPQYDRALAALDKLGPAARRNLLLEQLAASLKAVQPANLVVAAGISTAAPAIANLLKVIANLPNSLVVLPAIDLNLDDSLWDKLGPHLNDDGTQTAAASHETHPQFHLKLLLDRMGFRRDEVISLSTSKPAASGTITEIFSLPDDTEHWRELPASRKKLPHVKVMIAQDTAEEARAVAVMIREALEVPERRIAVVTPDRELGVRISAQLKRWNISVDDSAGRPLAQSPNGSMFMALAQMMADQFAPVSLLSVLKHPLVKNGDARLPWLDKVRILDLILRGPNGGVGLKATTRAIEQWLVDQTRNSKLADVDFVAWWQETSQSLQSLRMGEAAQFAEILTVLQSVADTLTAGAIWRGEAGRQLSAFLEELNGQDLSAVGLLRREAIVAVLAELFEKQVVRAPYGGHPRVAIYGLLEARLQQADFVICAGLNEGSWPQLPQPDPWLAPRIRRELKLAALERNIGLAAHDLATALGASQVVLTRAKRDRGGPTVASRFLLRIQALLGENVVTEDRALKLARLLDTPAAQIKYEKPAPMPSKQQRLVTLSVTDFDRLMADPFAFYANKILLLRPLDPVDAEPSYAWRGSVVHDILEHWANEDGCDPAKLMLRAEDLLSNSAVHPALRALWQPRIAEGLRWVARKTMELEADGRKLLLAEVKGSTEIGGVKVTGRADRIDRLADGTLAIVDYKTGSAPTSAQVAAGFSLQLGLIGLIAEDGGIKGADAEAGAFEYWSLAKNSGEFGKITSPVSDAEKKNRILTGEFVAFAEGEASMAIARWITGLEAFTAKLHPEFAPYADYDQLMRYEEWNGREPLPGGTEQ